MPSIRNCPDCGSSAFESDVASGDTYCTVCGTVLEQNAIVSEITFGEASTGAAIVQGSYVGQDQTRVRAFGPYRQQWTSESREQTLALGRRRIASVVYSFNMPERFVDSALRLYTQAVNINFIQGRRSRNVVASCLYVVCRFEKTSHMLIDFSDKLGVNVFTLGATFLKLVSALNIKLPLVDPSLYLSRFAAMLEFGAETQNVAADATRLIQRMNRDWMVYGRRPSGLCGAALLIAARMNNFRRSIAEIVQVVKIGDTTLKKRIEEFKMLPSASLSVQDFRSVVLEQDVDPPAFRKKSGPVKSEKNSRDNHTSAIKTEDNQLDGKESTSVLDSKVEKEISDTLHSKSFQLAYKSLRQGMPFDTQSTSTNETTISTKRKEKTKALNDNKSEHKHKVYSSLEYSNNEEKDLEKDEKLSDLDDDEIENILLSEKAVQAKTDVWMRFNQDYIEKQEEKSRRREKEMLEGTYKEPKKRKRRSRGVLKLDRTKDTTGDSIKAALQQRQYSKKINYEALNDILDD